MITINNKALSQIEEDSLNIENLINLNSEENFNKESISSYNNYSFLELLKFSKKNLEINDINEKNINIFYFLSEKQKKNFLNYKNQSGLFLDLSELQKIEDWDFSTISNFKKYVTIGNVGIYRTNTWSQKIFFQSVSYFNPPISYYLNDTNKNKFLGKPFDLLFKYFITNSNLNFGISAKQNAGEKFNKTGFDFYSVFFSFSPKQKSFIKRVIVGDFTVHFAQGLTEWQKFNISKSGEVIGVKKNFNSFDNHQSSTEFNFKKGIALEVDYKKFKLNTYISKIKIDASLNNRKNVSRILKTGYHRSENELNNKKNLKELSVGFEVKYTYKNLTLGLRNVYYRYNKKWESSNSLNPIYKYPFYTFYLTSFDYDYSYKSINLFGEISKTSTNKYSVLNGIIGSVNKKLDYSIIFRHFDNNYLSIYGNSFRESYTLSNEYGIYFGTRYLITSKAKIEYFTDIVKLPFLTKESLYSTKIIEHFLKLSLKFGSNFNMAISMITKNKKLEDYIKKSTNIEFIKHKKSEKFCFFISHAISDFFQINSQINYSNFIINKEKKEGFSCLTDLLIKKIFIDKIKGNIRLQFFEIESSNAYIYTLERDVLHDLNFYYANGKGIRYYLNLSYKISKLLHFSLKWSQTVYEKEENLNNANNDFIDNKKSALKIQLIFTL